MATSIQRTPTDTMPLTTAPPAGARFRTFSKRALGVVIFVLLFVFLVGPILTVMIWAFAERWRYPALLPTEWGLSYWGETLARADLRRALPTSIIVSIAVTLLSLVVCLPASYAFARMRFPGKQVLLTSFLFTNAFPRFGAYITIAVLFFQFDLIGTMMGVILIQLANTLLLMIWIPTGAFQGVDRSLEEAALDVGASRVQVFLRITLPQVAPALVAALMLTFIGTFYETYGALLVGAPNVITIPVIMFPLINNQPIPQPGAILSLVLFLPSLVILLFANRLLRQGYFTAGTGV